MLGVPRRASPAGIPILAPAPAATEAHPIAKPRVPHLTPLRMSVIGALLISVGPISTNLYTPAFTLLTQIFNTSEQAIRSTITVYLFGFAAAQLICGPLSDRFGRRPVVIGGLSLYVVGSTIAGLAGSVIVLAVGRLVQGVGACAGMALSRVMVVDAFSGAEAARIISLMSLILSVAPTLAPIFGGALITAFSWRLLFLLMALYGVALLGLVWGFPETNARREPRAIQPRTLLMNYASLLSSRSFVSQVALSSLGIGGFYTFLALAPFILMGRLGLSSTDFGLVSASLMASYLVGSLAINRLLQILPVVRLLRIGALSLLLAALGAAAGRHCFGVSIATIIGPMCLWMLGLSFLMPGITTRALVLFPRNAGAASALMGSLQMAMGFAGSALSSLFSDATIAVGVVPPAMAALGVIVYFAASWRGA